MKLPVVSGGEAVKAFRKLGYELDEQHGSPSGASPFQTTKNSPKELFGR